MEPEGGNSHFYNLTESLCVIVTAHARKAKDKDSEEGNRRSKACENEKALSQHTHCLPSSRC